MTEKEINAALREIRREMRERGIRRSSCFNGGHSPDSYRLNARVFELEIMRDRLRRDRAIA